jgi:Bacteriophage HK97-gp10, putative tail-component
VLTIKTEVSYLQFDRKAVRKAMREAARTASGQIKQLVSGRNGGGVTYVRNGRRYTASAPGQPPARYTGNLWRSIKGRASSRGYAMIVETLAPHAHLLELGTARMAARPSFAPGMANVAPLLTDLLRGAVDAGITVIAGSEGQAPAKVEVG